MQLRPEPSQRLLHAYPRPPRTQLSHSSESQTLPQAPQLSVLQAGRHCPSHSSSGHLHSAASQIRESPQVSTHCPCLHSMHRAGSQDLPHPPQCSLLRSMSTHWPWQLSWPEAHSNAGASGLVSDGSRPTVSGMSQTRSRVDDGGSTSTAGGRHGLHGRHCAEPGSGAYEFEQTTQASASCSRFDVPAAQGVHLRWPSGATPSTNSPRPQCPNSTHSRSCVAEGALVSLHPSSHSVHWEHVS
jgi:hypothetical protein